MIDPNDIKRDYTAHQPIGGYGFRKGMWTAIYRGQKFRFWGHVSHYSEEEDQWRDLQKQAARALLSGRAEKA